LRGKDVQPQRVQNYRDNISIRYDDES